MAEIYSRHRRKIYVYLGAFIRTQTIYVPIWSGIFLNSRPSPKATLNFFAAVPGTRFLSFPEFVEETELYLQSATLTLRLEDFMIDPFKEFSKLVEVMSVDLDLSRLRVDPPITKPYRYLAVKEKVPRFRSFINELNEDTKRRIEKIGYRL